MKVYQDALAQAPDDTELVEGLATAEDRLSDWRDREEFDALKALADEAQGAPDWVYGATLTKE